MKNFLFCCCILVSSILTAQEVSKEPVLDSVLQLSKEEQLKMLYSNPQVLRTRKKSYETRDAYNDELKLYNDAIELHPENEILYGFRGNFFLTTREFGKAIDDFSKSLELTDNMDIQLYSYMNRATAYLNIRNFQKGYEDLLKAYEIDPTNVGILINLGAVTDEIGKGDETIFYLEKAIQLNPDFYPAYGNLGFKYQEMGDHVKAIEYYDKVLELKPGEPLRYSNRAFNKLKIGDLEGAYRDINISISLYPENSYAYMVRALIYVEGGKLEEACDDLDHALDEGFTEMYGDKVIQLKKQYCANFEVLIE
ncbi:MAG: tetratricopeptide repeat protein [Christiangramia sp.]